MPVEAQRRRPITLRDPRIILRGYLNKTEPKIGRWLVNTWNAEREALKYNELAEAIATGRVPEAWVKRWQQDYSEFVDDVLGNGWNGAIGASMAGTAKDLAHILGWPFAEDTLGERIKGWILSRGGRLVVDLSEIQHKAIRALLHQYVVVEPLSAQELGRRLRPMIGLAPRDAGAVEKVRAGLVKGKEELPATAIEKQVQRYAGFLHRRRAERIARTEISSAYNFGQSEVVKQAREQGLFADKQVVKVWMTARDERVCVICGPLDGVEIDLDGHFDLGDRGTTETPPAHPDCRCAEGFRVIPLI